MAKELRLFSIGAFAFTAYLLHVVVTWVTTQTDPSSLGDGVAVTGIVGALVGLCKFIFEFAVSKSKDTNGEHGCGK